MDIMVDNMTHVKSSGICPFSVSLFSQYICLLFLYSLKRKRGKNKRKSEKIKEFSAKGKEREREDGGKWQGKLSIYRRLSIPSTL